MISFQRRSLLENIKYHLSPRYRAAADKRLQNAIRVLMDNPSMPCVVENHFIPNGHGNINFLGLF